MTFRVRRAGHASADFEDGGVTGEQHRATPQSRTILLKFHHPIKYSEWVFSLFYFTDGYRVPTISKREHALQEVLKMFRFTKFLLLYILKTQL